MANSLIVVESPTKVKTIKKFLGKDFHVLASMGHIKDLPKSSLGIDLEKDFEPTYHVIETKKKTIADLKKAAKDAENIYLAPDPDREGEAIAWHIADVVDAKKNKKVYRVLFNDLTKKTVLEAIQHPLPLDFDKYEAQQTRRILDRLVGYQISPILWDKVKRGLSAGRVQSVAVRIICEREEEISRFVPEEYWNLVAQFEAGAPPPFDAKLIKIGGKKAKVSSAGHPVRGVHRRKAGEKRSEAVGPAAVHDQQAAAGSLALAEVFRQENDERRPETLRRHRTGKRRLRGPDHLYANGFLPDRRGAAGGCPQLHQGKLFRRVSAAEASCL
jgi:DNA topoisomerase-1